jgi:hypothetical protein
MLEIARYFYRSNADHARADSIVFNVEQEHLTDFALD